MVRRKGNRKDRKNKGGAASAPPQQRRQQKARTRGARARNSASSARSATLPGGPAGQLEHKLNDEDVAIVNYLSMVTDPDAEPSYVPVLLGEFELESDQCRVELRGAATAGAAGTAYVGVSADGWLELNPGPGAEPNCQFLTYNGGSTGCPVWASTVASNNNLPAYGAAVGTNATVTMPYLDGGHNASTRYRLTSAHLEVWSDASAMTAQGDICVAVVRHEGAMKDLALNGTTYAQMALLPQEYVVHREYPLAGWQSGHRVHTHVTPWNEQCFRMQESVAVGAGTATASAYAMAVSGVGLASGQTFQYRVVYTYETSRAKSYVAKECSHAPRPLLAPSTVVNALAPVRPTGPTKGPMGHASGKMPAAILEGNPALAQAVTAAGSAVGNGLKAKAKSGLSWLAGKVPYVGSLLQTGVDWLFG